MKFSIPLTGIVFILLVFPLWSQESVRIGYVNVMDDAPVLVAYGTGFYEDAGLAPELVRFSSGTDLIRGIVTGRLDVGVLGFTNAITWASRGAELRIVGGAQRGYHSVLARDDSGIWSIEDLEGMSLASQKQGSTADIVLSNVVFPAGDITKNELVMRYVAPATAVQALASGAVDAAFLFEPYATIAKHTARVREIMEVGDVWPFPCMVVITSADTLENRRSSIDAVLDAQKRAVTLLTESPDRAASILVPYFVPSGTVPGRSGPIPAEQILSDAVQSNTFDWRLTEQDIERIRDVHGMMLEARIIQRPIDLDLLLDTTWQQQAAD